MKEEVQDCSRAIFKSKNHNQASWRVQRIIVILYPSYKVETIVEQKNCLFCLPYYTTNALLKGSNSGNNVKPTSQVLYWMTRKKLKTNRNAFERSWRPVGRYWGVFWSTFSMACETSSALYSIPKHLKTSRFGLNKYLIVFPRHTYIIHYSSHNMKSRSDCVRWLTFCVKYR